MRPDLNHLRDRAQARPADEVAAYRALWDEIWARPVKPSEDIRAVCLAFLVEGAPVADARAAVDALTR